MSNHPGKIVIDLDGVIAGPKPEGGSYLDCPPNGPIIKRLRELKELGWTIAIHTSRNVKTHEHNLGKITAQTVPLIIDWLDQHGVPYDEIWPGKPWPGKVGFYVDDRAIHPRELIELSTNELLARARGIHFDPTQPNWTAGTQQVWGILDARERYHVLVNGSATRSIKQLREEGFRTLILLDPAATINPGLDEQLRRLGARWARFESKTPFNRAVVPILRDLVMEGQASYDSEIFEVIPHEEDQNTLESRHFNSVTADGETVTKVAHDEKTQQKLAMELAWLGRAEAQVGYLTTGRLTPVPGGYQLRRAAGGSLNHVLMRDHLDEIDIAGLATGLHELWGSLNALLPDKGASDTHRFDQHRQLVVDKSMSRVNDLDNVLQAAGAGDCYNDWVVNGENLGSPYEALVSLIQLIPEQTRAHHGGWHGDLCPGNIVLMDNVRADGTPDLRVIDPRGSIDGKTVTLCGDQRYDLGKIAHALRWGYDAITEGWRDCFAELGPGITHVSLRVWDEDFPGHVPNRLRLWDKLVELNRLTAGECELNDPQVHAFAALQLITCAPLHSEDSERVLALVARGLQAARYATLRLKNGTNR